MKPIGRLADHAENIGKLEIVACLENIGNRPTISPFTEIISNQK